MNYSFVRGFGARGKSNEVHAGFPKVVTWARRQLLVKMDFFVWYYMLFVFYSGVYCCHMQNKLFAFIYRATLCYRGICYGFVSVCVCVCLSQIGVLLKRLNIGSYKQHCTIAHEV